MVICLEKSASPAIILSRSPSRKAFFECMFLPLAFIFIHPSLDFKAYSFGIVDVMVQRHTIKATTIEKTMLAMNKKHHFVSENIIGATKMKKTEA